MSDNFESDKNYMGEPSRYEKIRDLVNKANDSIKYLDLERKTKKGVTITKYAPVHEKLKAFRFVYPEGSIETKMVDEDKVNKTVTFKAQVFNENGSLLGTGYASESLEGSFVNTTSMIENCETSAIGRALSIAGFGVVDGIASAENMQEVRDRKENENGMRLCHRCYKEIHDAQDRKGKVISAQDIVTESLRIYGHTYCLPCLAKIKAEKIKLLEVES